VLADSFSGPLTLAIAEAEKLVAAAPHIETEADLLEGLQYLAGCIAGCMHLAFDYERDHPFLQSGTGPFTKMGLDNPDTLYFGTRVQADRDYVVTGRRGTTTDLSFQLLGGEYTDDNVPASQAAFDDRELEIAADGSFEWRVRPTGPGQLVIREVYGDWSAQRGTLTISRLDTAGTAPPPPTRQIIEKRYATAGKQLVNRVKTWLQFPQWFQADPRWPGDPVLIGRAFRPAARSGAGDHDPGLRRSLSRVPVGQHVVHLAGLHQPPDLAEQHPGPSGSGRQGPHRRRRPESGSDQLG